MRKCYFEQTFVSFSKKRQRPKKIPIKFTDQNNNDHCRNHQHIKTNGPFRGAPQRGHSRGTLRGDRTTTAKSKMAAGVASRIKEGITMVPRDMVRVSQNMEVPWNNMVSTYFLELVPLSQLEHVHPLVLNLFPNQQIGNFPLAGRLKYVLPQWQKLTSNPKILEWVTGLTVDFMEKPVQHKLPHQANMSREESNLVKQEVEAMLEKVSRRLRIRKINF